MKKAIAWLRSLRPIDDWRREVKRLYSAKVCAFWCVVGGLLIFWPATEDHLPLWAYGAGCVVLSVTFGVARFLKQPGTDT